MKDYNGIWWACWLFPIPLATLSFIIALNPADRYFIVIGIFFMIVHFIGFVKVRKPCT